MNKISIVKIIAIIALLVALGDNPYFYYQILRWIVCGVAGYSAYIAFEQKNSTWSWIFAVIAVLFNPVAPFYFERAMWIFVDIIAALLIVVSIFRQSKHNIKKHEKI
jgi:hypothetical protein